MNFRQGEEIIIEPHAFTFEEFNSGSPLIEQILKYGEEIHF